MPKSSMESRDYMDGLKIRWRLFSEEWEPTTRQRGIYVYQQLQEMGVDADKWDGSEKADIIVLQYTLDKLHEAMSASPVVISDVNDRVFAEGHQHQSQMLAGFPLVDAVVAGSVRLEQELKKHHHIVRLIEEAVDQKFLDVQKKKHDGINVLFFGMHDNIIFTQDIDDVLQKLSKMHNFTVHFVIPSQDGQGRSNAEKVSNKPYPSMFHEWSMDTLLELMSIADIGIAPLFQNMWCWSKSSNKQLSLMAAGIPTAVTDVPSYRRITQNGVNGLLCYTMHDWYENLECLLTDSNLRSRIGKAGRKTALEYTIDRVSDQWVRLFREVRKS